MAALAVLLAACGRCVVAARIANEVPKEELCAAVSSVLDPQEACTYVRAHCTSGSLIPYLELYYCSITAAGWLAQALAKVAAVALLLLLFRVLGSTADDYFSPTLMQLSRDMGLPPRFAGVTLLALGNGAPDLSSSIAAVKAGNYPLALGAQVGSCMFVGCVVAGSVLLRADGVRLGGALSRDVAAYCTALVAVAMPLLAGKISRWACISLLALYGFYVVAVLSADVWHRTSKRWSSRRMQAALLEAEAEPEPPIVVLESLSLEEGEEGQDAAFKVAGGEPRLLSAREYGIRAWAAMVQAVPGGGRTLRTGAGEPAGRYVAPEAATDIELSRADGQPSPTASMPVAAPPTPPRGASPIPGDPAATVGPDSLVGATPAVVPLPAAACPPTPPLAAGGVAGLMRGAAGRQGELGQMGGGAVDADVAAARGTHRWPEPPPLLPHDGLASGLPWQGRADGDARGHDCLATWRPGEPPRCPRLLRYRAIAVAAAARAGAVAGAALAAGEWPFTLLRRGSVPLVEAECYERGWLLMALAAAPAFVTVYLEKASTCWLLGAAAVGALSCVAGWWATRGDGGPPFWGLGTGFPIGAALVAVYGFLVAAMWIDRLATELVGLLTFFGALSGVSHTVLGLTLLAWGNSMSDISTNLAMVRRGMSNMAITACFAGPAFNLLVGVGAGFLAYFHVTGVPSAPVRFPPQAAPGLALALANAALLVAAGALAGGRVPRHFGWVSYGLYGAYMAAVLALSLGF